MKLIRSSSRLLSVAIAVILLASACGDDPDVAAVEGGESLESSELEELVDEPDAEEPDTVETDGDAVTVGEETLTGADVAELADKPGEGVIERAAAVEAITGWVRNEVFYSALAEAGFTDIEPYLADARTEFEEFVAANPEQDLPEIDSAAAQELIRNVALGPALTAYMLEVEGFVIEWPVQLCSSHILVETEEEAAAAIARLDAGEDFADVAIDVSTDGSAASGGDLGCVDPATLVPEFVAGAQALGGPGITPPVQSQFGWHVINVRSFEATPSDDPEAIQQLVLSSPEFSAFQMEAFAREVTIDARYGVWDAESAAVVAAAE